MSAPTSRAAVRAALLALIDGLDETCSVSVTVGTRCLGSFAVEPAPANGNGHAAPLTACAEDILYVLGEAGRRLTTPEILTALARANMLHGEGTVKETLAQMVKDKVIDNRSDERPRGYAMPGVCRNGLSPC